MRIIIILGDANIALRAYTTLLPSWQWPWRQREMSLKPSILVAYVVIIPSRPREKGRVKSPTRKLRAHVVCAIMGTFFNN